MAKKKIKLGDLTLKQIIEIGEKYKGSCAKCPLYEISYINCFEVCCSENSMTKYRLKALKEEFNKEIKVDYEK